MIKETLSNSPRIIDYYWVAINLSPMSKTFVKQAGAGADKFYSSNPISMRLSVAVWQWIVKKSALVYFQCQSMPVAPKSKYLLVQYMVARSRILSKSNTSDLSAGVRRQHATFIQWALNELSLYELSFCYRIPKGYPFLGVAVQWVFASPHFGT